jgi:hypothetical protein
MTIKINCDTCGEIHEVKRDKKAPDNAVSMGCNWCPNCEDKADDYYDEWYNYPDPDDKGDDPNQLILFSITDDILKPQKELTNILK